MESEIPLSHYSRNPKHIIVIDCRIRDVDCRAEYNRKLVHLLEHWLFKAIIIPSGCARCIMRILLLAYGGTEAVVGLLSDGLALAGHDVTLFASGDSTTSGKLHWVLPPRPPHSL